MIDKAMDERYARCVEHVLNYRLKETSMNIKAKITNSENNGTVPMGDMKPMDVGVLDESEPYGGHIVMRSRTGNSVCSLTDPEHVYWSGTLKGHGCQVRLLKKSEKLTITIEGTV